jgi:hypothetical protein
MDILKFSAFRFYKTANTLVVLSKVMESFTPEERKTPIDAYAQSTMLDMATKIRDECEAINLSMSLISAKTLLKLVEEKASWDRIKELFDELNGRIRDEIKDNLFLYIPQTHARYFDDPNPFGQE